MRSMQVFTVIGSMFFTYSAVLAQEQPRRPGPFLIYGPVRTIRDERVSFKNENGLMVESPRRLVMEMHYNEDGTKQETTVYDENGVLFSRRVETFESDGRIIESSVFKSNDKLESRTVTHYDDMKQEDEITVYEADGSVRERTTFRRNGDKVQAETISYDKQGAVIDRSITTTDLNTHATESTNIGPRGALQTQLKMTNNPDGGRESRMERSDGAFKREVTKGPEESSERIVYNRDGSIRSTERFLREFDSHHNLTKVTHLSAKGDSKDFVTVDITYRTLSYYGQN